MWLFDWQGTQQINNIQGLQHWHQYPVAEFDHNWTDYNLSEMQGSSRTV